ncbi:hypothetical protein GCD18_12600 [Salmonella enterica]|nr:hypothetical protein [Salmonella enterica]EIB3469897.1 hypothetical protein [Salmonella enterica]EIO1816544.1 hypothetical protein [Salmonella enterica]EJQ1097816.1 hypothetical protein [Salmonella enterica]EJS6409475.1 hypothetical protein [Salmonella enterica]
MTTNNHPAHGPVSLDRLHQIREILSKASAQSDGGNLGYAMVDAVKVIDGAIASFGAEPVEFLPDNLTRALTILGVALPVSKEEFNLDAERWMQRLINRVIRLESELTPPAPVVDADDNFYSWFGREWHEHYQHNQYTTAAKQTLGVMAESAWKAGRSAAMLQGKSAGNSPAVPDGWQLVPKEPTEAMNKAGWAAINEHDAINPTYRAMLAAAPQQEVK